VQLVRLGAFAPGVHLIGFVCATDELFETALDPDERDAVDASIVRARSELGEEAFGRAWAEGQTMKLQQTIAYALSDDPGTDRRAPKDGRDLNPAASSTYLEHR
jgi:hypothetical protein